MEFLLSCISTRHSMLKKHWSTSEQKKQQTECPLTVLGSLHKPKEDQGGLLALLDENGHMRAGAELPMPAGIALADDGFLVASSYDVHKIAADLSTFEERTVSLPTFNMLHSLSRSKRGYLVASTGLDAILDHEVVVVS